MFLARFACKDVDAKIDNEQEGIALPVDYSFSQVKTPLELLRFPPRIDAPLALTTPKDADDKWLSKSLKLNKNILEDLDFLPRVIGTLFPNSNWLTWLDLSCNLLQKIPPELVKMTNLKILYLHGNKIKTTRELTKLRPLENLAKLTLHGNPAELEPGYFIAMLTIFPGLIKLDFTGISANERMLVNSIQKKIHM